MQASTQWKVRQVVLHLSGNHSGQYGEFQIDQESDKCLKIMEFFHLIFIRTISVHDVAKENILQQILAEIQGGSIFQSILAGNELLLEGFPIISYSMFLIILGIFALY